MAPQRRQPKAQPPRRPRSYRRRLDTPARGPNRGLPPPVVQGQGRPPAGVMGARAARALSPRSRSDREGSPAAEAARRGRRTRGRLQGPRYHCRRCRRAKQSALAGSPRRREPRGEAAGLGQEAAAACGRRAAEAARAKLADLAPPAGQGAALRSGVGRVGAGAGVGYALHREALPVRDHPLREPLAA